jgi:hypothetical protein
MISNPASRATTDDTPSMAYQRVTLSRDTPDDDWLCASQKLPGYRFFASGALRSSVTICNPFAGA